MGSVSGGRLLERVPQLLKRAGSVAGWAVHRIRLCSNLVAAGETLVCCRFVGVWSDVVHQCTDTIVIDDDKPAGGGNLELPAVTQRASERSKCHPAWFISIELTSEYAVMVQKRDGVTVGNPELLLKDGETLLAAIADGVENERFGRWA